ncbi:hypothetical protein [Streptomyces sp. JH34]|uniref:hypothetical protein n=1 Tax=unclassified Streptomyces TaxID=2593676 RepID=UPI0023F7E348|nr:hypothetical protein [Streptomyces sp. JH34]MDF6021258.1 hypothetical protein [Streptomyces sp. JH34]
MRSPARLVTGTAAAALTAAALGLAIPSAHADGLGGPERTVATAAPGSSDCGPEDVVATAPCDSGGTVDDPGGAEGGLDPLAEPGSGEPEAADGTDLAGDLGVPEDPPAESEPSWPQTEEGDTGTGDEAGTVRQPGAGTGTRPTPPPETDPGSAKPPVPPGHRPTAAPSPGPSRPSGHVGTGVGGSAAPDTAQLATGAGLVGAAAVAGVLLLRRSRRAYGTRRAYGMRR